MTTIAKKREHKINQLPALYSAKLHIIFTPLLFISVIFYLCSLYTFTILHLFLLPLIIILLNLNEYLIHKFTFHHKLPFLGFLYNKHTKNHHVLFTDDNMKITNLKEIAYILIPLPTLFLFFIFLFGLSFLIKIIFSFNFALFFSIISLIYVLLYEIIHLLFHYSDKLLGSKSLHKYLSRFHKLHHNTRYMNNWNFNVTIPIWDKILKTLKKDN